MKGLPSNYFDAVLSDPPYAYRFMGNRWDYEMPSVNVWSELLRVVKPGAHALLFGGPRTFHRLVVNVEGAGFIPIDLLMYLHGKGFPKSLDIAKAIDKSKGHWRGRAGKQKSGNAAMGGPNLERTLKGEAATEAALPWQGYGTALKPAYEPVLLAMKMLDGTFAENVQKWGTGALAIDACRIGDRGDATTIGGFTKTGMFSIGGTDKGDKVQGRWPANVMLDEEAAEMLDAQTGERPSTLTGRADPKSSHVHPASKEKRRASMFGNEQAGGAVYADTGGASRFFYTTKVSRGEREAGCSNLEQHAQGVGALRDGNRAGVINQASPPGSKGASSPRAGAGRTGLVSNIHPTLKAIELTRWLATMLLPPPRADGQPRRILVPFSGAGSEMIGCLQAGWDEVIGIEGEANYIEIAKSRITKGGVFSGLLDKSMRKQASKQASKR